MKNLSDNRIINIIINLLFLAAAAKLIAVIALWFLPQDGVQREDSSLKQMPYVRADFHNLINGKRKRAQSELKERSDAISIKNMVLVGLYGNERSGFAIVATKADPKKTTIVAIEENYKGYRLSKIFLDYVIFTKNAKEYILRLQDISSNKENRVNSTQEAAHTIARSDIEYYAKNPTQIWRDISIKELKKSGKISGFKVTKIRKNSKFSKLGLKRGDIIIEANGRALHSYKDVMGLYENMDILDVIALKIKRGNQEKEIIYEIH